MGTEEQPQYMELDDGRLAPYTQAEDEVDSVMNAALAALAEGREDG